jgi:short-subunit dehydrogenase
MASFDILQRVLWRAVLLVCILSLVAPLIHPAVPVLDEGIVVITGCTVGGLGFQVAKDIIAKRPELVRVVCTVRKEKDGEALAKELATDRLRTVVMDVTDQRGVDQLSRLISNEKVIGLVNNAGISGNSLLDVSPDIVARP